MPGRALSLVLFTLLTQMAIGLLLVLAAVQARGSHLEQPETETGRALLTILVMLVVAGSSASFHLGRPVGALRVLANLRSSWLSREILLLMLFGLGCSLLAALHWLDPGSSSLQRITLMIAVLAGLALLYTIGRLYMLRTVPLWNSLATPISFLLTTLLLGAAAYVSILATKGTHTIVFEESLSWIGPLASVLLVAQVLILLGLLLGSGRAARILSRRVPLVVLRLALAAAGVLLLLAAAARVGLQASSVSLALAGCGFLMASEVAGRLLFYASYERLGI